MDEKFMRLAIDQAGKGTETGQTPLGAVVARAGQVLAFGHNTVWRDSDPTAHAEVNAIRKACNTLRGIANEAAAGLNELLVEARNMMALGIRALRPEPGLLGADCRELFQLGRGRGAS